MFKQQHDLKFLTYITNIQITNVFINVQPRFVFYFWKITTS